MKSAIALGAGGWDAGGSGVALGDGAGTGSGFGAGSGVTVAAGVAVGVAVGVGVRSAHVPGGLVETISVREFPVPCTPQPT